MFENLGDFIDAYPDDFTYNDECRHTPVVEARTVYVLLPKNVPVSRCSRLQWMLQHLNTTIAVPTILKTVSNTYKCRWPNFCVLQVFCVWNRNSFLEFLKETLLFLWNERYHKQIVVILLVAELQDNVKSL